MRKILPSMHKNIEGRMSTEQIGRVYWAPNLTSGVKSHVYSKISRVSTEKSRVSTAKSGVAHRNIT